MVPSPNVGLSSPPNKSEHLLHNDTIVALATAPGRAALAILRMSGPAVRQIAGSLLHNVAELRPRYAQLARIVDADGALIDEGVALFFAGPASATGEDVLELHVHGSPLVVELTLNAALAAGARLAQPGEFTKRAFLAGKLDLSAAEAVADLIDATHRSAARAAAGRLAGGLAGQIQAQRERLQRHLEELAAAIDFPDEVAEPSRSDLIHNLGEIRGELQRLIADAPCGRLVREGASVALVGPPNAGKSSLLNALLGEERALVSPIPGTTRDTIEEAIECGGLLLRLIDTAGLREGADLLEQAGIERSRRTLEQARLVLIVLDGSEPLDASAQAVLAATATQARLIFLNKADLGQVVLPSALPHDVACVVGSVFDGASLEALRGALRFALVGEGADLERASLARVREVDAAREALAALELAAETLHAGVAMDFVSGDLLHALAALGKITGDTVTEEVLTGIFARFCIGK